MKTETDSKSHLQASDGATIQALFKDIFEGPQLFLSSLDLNHNVMVFTPMTLNTYASSDFLDSRLNRGGGPDVTIDSDVFMTLFDRFRPEQQPLNFIFHTGYSCSTLLARCLQNLKQTLVLKEPAPLRWISESWFTKPPTHDLRKFNTVVGSLLARRFGRERVVVKSTSHCINMMPELLGLHAENKAVFLFSSLEDALASYLKDPLRRKEARFYLAVMRDLVPSDLPLGPQLAILDAQIISLMWMVEVRFYCQIARSLSDGRLLALNCNELLNNPALALRRVASHFGIAATQEDLLKVLESEAFKRYAKGQHVAFDRTTRRAHLDLASDQYAKEIEFATNWARNLPIWANFGANLPNELKLST